MKNIQRIVFFGTHELAVPVLEKLVSLGVPPVLIITRPHFGLAPGPFAREDLEPPPHPVAIWANEKGIEVVRSDAVAEPELREKIVELEPDLLLLADYGRPLPPELIEKAAKGALQVHNSLLPKYRGEHPLRRAISEGEKKAGVSVFVPDDEPWGGGVLMSEEVEIDEGTFGSLYPRFEELALSMLEKSLAKVDGSKTLKTRKQTAKTSGPIPHLTDRHRRAPWHLESDAVEARLRAYSPPGLFTSCRLQTFEIVQGRALKLVEAPYGESGTFLGIRAGCLAVLCGRQSAFGIEEVRREDGSSYSAHDAASSLGLSVGDLFV